MQGVLDCNLMSTAAFCLCLTVELPYVTLDTLSKWRSHTPSDLAACVQ